MCHVQHFYFLILCDVHYHLRRNNLSSIHKTVDNKDNLIQDVYLVLDIYKFLKFFYQYNQMFLLKNVQLFFNTINTL